jgi:2-C-methyl-D-erythritol 4-phosphate cytidylyltransferase/2-C-methyl-D-erythritol 2,4-cyclodiphosphate synthase
MSTSAIITAGGSGQRMGGTTPKQFLPLAGVPVLVHTVRAFQRTPAIDQIILVVPAEHLEFANLLVQQYNLKRCRVIMGGILRQDSVEQGLQAASEAEYLVIHDGVRPLVSPALIEKCLKGAMTHGAAITALPVKDTLKAVFDQTITETVDRTNLWQAQTPQAMKRSLLAEAYRQAKQDNFVGTDEASLLEHIGCKAAIVTGSEMNLKITHPEDLNLAEALLLEKKMSSICPVRIGHGYDAHALVRERDLILGGVSVPHSKGLLGHSDADVVTHALCDALLGAAGLGDIGRHFPDSEAQYKGIDSLKLLKKVMELLGRQGLQPGNADITIIAQQPKLAPYLDQMRDNLAAVCLLEQKEINLKATTTEGLGFTGRQEGIACHAVVTLYPQRQSGSSG